MPPKKKTLKAACAACAICNTEVENSKDECLHCESCSQKFHRYCAGVTLSEHITCVNGSSYECLHCFRVRKEATVTDLKDCIAALKAEILELRSTVQELSSKGNRSRYRSHSRRDKPLTLRDKGIKRENQ